MKLNLKRIANAIKSSKTNGQEEPPKYGPGGPKTAAELADFNKLLAKQGKYYDSNSRRVFDLKGGKSGKEMQKDSSIMKLKTFQSPTEKEMSSNAVMSGVDRKALRLDEQSKFESLSDKDLIKKGFVRNSKSGDVFPIKK